MNDLVSVIIPTHNRLKFLKNAIKSVKDQTYSNIEILIIDDASTDGTQEKFLNLNDDRIKYFRNNISLKAPKSRNIGIENAKGKYIAFLDDDDEWFPEKLKFQVQKFNENKEIGMVYTKVQLIFNDLNIKYNTNPIKKGNIYKDLLLKNYIGVTPSVMIKQEVLKSVGGFDSNLPARQDYDLWIRVSKICKIDFVDKALTKSFYRNNMNRISTNLNNNIEALRILNKKYEKEYNKFNLEELNKKEANINFYLASQAIKLFDSKLARNYFLKSYKIDKNKVALASYILSYFGSTTLIRTRFLLSKLRGN